MSPQQVASLYAEIGAKVDGFQKGAATVHSGLDGIAQKAGLSGQQIAQAMGITTAVVGTTAGVIMSAYDSYSQLAEQVRDLSLVSGTSAEETSRFIQVLDDYQLTADDATAATKKLKDQGLTPNIETLAMLADKFRAINDPADRMQFIQENLGKSGAKWVNILNQGGDALRANSAAIQQNLILNEQQIQIYEVGRLAIDKYKDKLEGFKVSLGQNVGNVLAFAEAHARANEIVQENTKIVGRGVTRTIEYEDALNMAIAEQLKSADASIQQAESMKAAEEATKAAIQAEKDYQQANADMISGAIDIQKSWMEEETSIEDINAKIRELKAEKEKLYPWETEKIDEINQKLEEQSLVYENTLDSFRNATQQKITMMAVEKIAMEDGIAGYSEAEFAKAEAILQTSDIASAAAFSQQQAMEILSSAVANSQITVEQFGQIMAQVMADGVTDVNEVKNAIAGIQDKTVTITVLTQYGEASIAAPELEMRGRGTNRAHAAGGDFLIPASYGYEGFRLGNGDTASGGETISIGKRGGNEDIVNAIMASRMDENRLANLIRDAVLQAGK